MPYRLARVFNRLAKRPDHDGFSFAAITQGAVISIALDVGGLGLAYVLQIALARSLGVDAYGQYAYAIAIVFTLAVPLQLGLNIGLLRFLPEYRSSNDDARARGLITYCFMLPVSLTAALILLVAMVRWQLEGSIGFDIFTVTVLALPGVVAASLCVHTGRALGRFVGVKAIQEIGRPALLIGSVLVVGFAGVSLDAAMAIGLFGVCSVLVTLAQSWAMKRALKDCVHGSKAVYESERWLRTSLPFTLTAGSAILLQHTDILMVGLLGPSSDVGIYAAASRLSNLVLLPLVGINMLAAPAYARLFSLNDPTAMQTLARRLAHAMFWPALSIAFGLIIFGSTLLSGFGEAFESGYLVMSVLTGAALLNVGCGSVGYLANMIGEQMRVAGVRVVAILINACLNAVAIPVLGLMGAALSTAIAVFVTNVWLHEVVSRRQGTRTSIISALVEQRARRSSKT